MVGLCGPPGCSLPPCSPPPSPLAHPPPWGRERAATDLGAHRNPTSFTDDLVTGCKFYTSILLQFNYLGMSHPPTAPQCTLVGRCCCPSWHRLQQVPCPCPSSTFCPDPGAVRNRCCQGTPAAILSSLGTRCVGGQVREGRALGSPRGPQERPLRRPSQVEGYLGSTAQEGRLRLRHSSVSDRLVPKEVRLRGAVSELSQAGWRRGRQGRWACPPAGVWLLVLGVNGSLRWPFKDEQMYNEDRPSQGSLKIIVAEHAKPLRINSNLVTERTSIDRGIKSLSNFYRKDLNPNLFC